MKRFKNSKQLKHLLKFLSSFYISLENCSWCRTSHVIEDKGSLNDIPPNRISSIPHYQKLVAVSWGGRGMVNRYSGEYEKRRWLGREKETTLRNLINCLRSLYPLSKLHFRELIWFIGLHSLQRSFCTLSSSYCVYVLLLRFLYYNHIQNCSSCGHRTTLLLITLCITNSTEMPATNGLNHWTRNAKGNLSSTPFSFSNTLLLPDIPLVF